MKEQVAVKRVVDANLKVRVKADNSDVELTNVKMAMNLFDEIALEEVSRVVAAEIPALAHQLPENLAPVLAKLTTEQQITHLLAPETTVIIAIKNDDEAPIFNVADYNLHQDLFTALPELESIELTQMN
ncbi:hypothetical protein [Motiliproteus sp. MSK22-1]|uniref:hypothetical protein n=1 Tax=Motiliproteus sp. MSK22-1 TaxID=1897630 RepID=UPI000977A179|nr:hypothetical protein BGP75_16165 [Motiliproteus sp. MSK22-1]